MWVLSLVRGQDPQATQCGQKGNELGRLRDPAAAGAALGTISVVTGCRRRPPGGLAVPPQRRRRCRNSEEPACRPLAGSRGPRGPGRPSWAGSSSVPRQAMPRPAPVCLGAFLLLGGDHRRCCLLVLFFFFNYFIFYDKRNTCLFQRI